MIAIHGPPRGCSIGKGDRQAENQSTWKNSLNLCGVIRNSRSDAADNPGIGPCRYLRLQNILRPWRKKSRSSALATSAPVFWPLTDLSVHRCYAAYLFLRNQRSWRETRLRDSISPIHGAPSRPKYTTCLPRCLNLSSTNYAAWVWVGIWITMRGVIAGWTRMVRVCLHSYARRSWLTAIVGLDRERTKAITGHQDLRQSLEAAKECTAGAERRARRAELRADVMTDALDAAIAEKSQLGKRARKD
jgi:hypothetical protein